MSGLEKISQINWQLFIALVLPGLISLRIYSLIHPSDSKPLKDNLLEAIAYSVINAALLWWAILMLIGTSSAWLQYGLVVLIFFVAPAVWPFVLDQALSRLEGLGVILRRPQTAWDDFFLRRQQCWIIVHLKDGRRIGGYYGDASYATLYPRSGHLYLEELWELDQETGKFEEKIPESGGLILRPDDYHLIEIKSIVDGSARRSHVKRP